MPAVNAWQQLLADLATDFWRLQRKHAAALARGDLEGLQRLQRDVTAMADRFQAAGVEILDHTGETYEPGKAVRVLAFQPCPEVQREEVGETIKPTVYYQGHWLQMAEVIVNTPEAK
jgi:hypothetical protein